MLEHVAFTICSERAVDAQPGFLNSVLGVLAMGENPSRVPHTRLIIAVDERRESRGILPPGARHEGGVRRVEGAWHIGHHERRTDTRPSRASPNIPRYGLRPTECAVVESPCGGGGGGGGCADSVCSSTCTVTVLVPLD